VTILEITVIILRNPFYIKYCKKTFLNPDFCKFWRQFDSFDVSESCQVIVESIQLEDEVTIIEITVINLKNTLYIEYWKKTVLSPNFCNFWAQFDSFDVSSSCHVIVEHYLARPSRDHCQNNCHKSQKHILFQILQENVSNSGFLQLLKIIFSFLNPPLGGVSISLKWKMSKNKIKWWE